jgi:hypothetical protein
MKKKLIYLPFLFFIMSLVLVSCSKDDDGNGNNDDDPEPPVGSVFGNYGCPLVQSIFQSSCTLGVFNSDGEIVRIVIPRDNADDLGINDEVLEDRPMRLQATEIAGQTDSIDLVVTLSVTLGNTLVPVPVPLRVGYNPATKAFTQSNIEVSIEPTGIPNTVIEARLVSLNGSFGEGNFQAVMVLDDWQSSSVNNIDATLYLSGVKE